MPTEDMRDYHDLKSWLRGEKPPAAGRTWRRVAKALVPDTVEPYVGEGIGLAVAGGLTLVGGFAISVSLLLYAPTVVDLALSSSATPGLVFPGMPMLPVVKRACATVFQITGACMLIMHAYVVASTFIRGGR